LSAGDLGAMIEQMKALLDQAKLEHTSLAEQVRRALTQHLKSKKEN
jgi:hypothetical protein